MTDRERVARALARDGFGREWDDFLPANAHDTDQVDLLEYADAAIAALRPEAQGVKVKPLRWSGGHAHSLGFHYFTERHDDGIVLYRAEGSGRTGIGVFEAASGAESAAQADLRRQVLSALDRPEAQDGVARAAEVLLDALNEASELDDVVHAAMQKEADHEGTEEWVFVLRAALRALSQGGE